MGGREVQVTLQVDSLFSSRYAQKLVLAALT